MELILVGVLLMGICVMGTVLWQAMAPAGQTVSTPWGPRTAMTLYFVLPALLAYLDLLQNL
ncbi:hypothetical protein GO986_20405 [Deinococcus sp. HMF7620]|uniref:Uncharacterized protein n=1 Tax=Deinococcus arboris TaxID=2682977 RepID=A0A7C9IF23_9DEIO|nr:MULTISPECIES: hypothetical protein [Deinococcus]MBZ9752246.1 hypothetical protein [Deinococcus betulae]MVN89106.1 hypothetical protein [Deinococcus arboris]